MKRRLDVGWGTDAYVSLKVCLPRFRESNGNGVKMMGRMVSIRADYVFRWFVCVRIYIYLEVGSQKSKVKSQKPKVGTALGYGSGSHYKQRSNNQPAFIICGNVNSLPWWNCVLQLSVRRFVMLLRVYRRVGVSGVWGSIGCFWKMMSLLAWVSWGRQDCNGYIWELVGDLVLIDVWDFVGFFQVRDYRRFI